MPKIVSNNKPRHLISWRELPDEIQNEFDYIDSDSDSTLDYRFVKYKGAYYDVYDAQTITIRDGSERLGWSVYDSPLSHWHAVTSNSYFDGLLFRFTDNYQRVIVGRYYS
jgi:hypothetical protein